LLPGEHDQLAVTDLVSELHGYETMLQSLYAQGGRLATAAIAAQTDRNLSPVAGYQILTAISNAQLMVSTAMGRIAEAHRQLEYLGRMLGYDVQAFGDVLKPPASPCEANPVGLAA